MKISVIVPVYREADGIHRFLESLSAVFPAPENEIIVVDGSPGRETMRAVLRPDIRTVHCAKGRARQMNKGAATARGDILLFLHADTVLPLNAAGLIQKTLAADTTVCGGAFSLGIDAPGACFQVIEYFANLRSGLTRVPYGDQSLFLRKRVFFQMGGFPDIPVMEDLELMTRIRKTGRKITILKQKSMTSSRRWQKEGIAACTLRNWLIRLLYHAGIPATRLARFYP